MSVVRTAETSIEVRGLFDITPSEVTVLDHAALLSSISGSDGYAMVAVSSPSDDIAAQVNVVIAADLDDESGNTARATVIADIPWPELVAFARTIVAMAGER